MNDQQFHWNLGSPSRKISRLDHDAGVSTIEVKMIPGLAASAFLAVVFYFLVFKGVLAMLPAITLGFLRDFGWHPFFAFVASVPIFLVFGFLALFVGTTLWQLIAGTEILRLTDQKTEYIDKSRKALSRTASIKSLVNIEVRGQLGSKFLQERYGITAELTGRPLEFGVGLSKDDAERILTFILEHHPNIR